MPSYSQVPQQVEANLRSSEELKQDNTLRKRLPRVALRAAVCICGVVLIGVIAYKFFDNIVSGGESVKSSLLLEQGRYDDDDYSPDVADTSSTITLVTGTHVLASKTLDDLTSAQHPLCTNLSSSLFEFWTAQRIRAYGEAHLMIEQTLANIKKEEVSCILSSSESYASFLSFPVSSRPEVTEDDCHHSWKQIRKGYVNAHRLYYDIFLFRPDLITLSRAISKQRIKFKLVSIVGYGLSRASLENEGCPIYKPILSQHPVYKYSLIWKLLADLEQQIGRIRDELTRNVVINCGEPSPVGIKQLGQMIKSTDNANLQTEICGTYEQPLAEKVPHFASFQQMKLFNGMRNVSPIPKTRFNGTRMVFVAGLEGVGHHMFTDLAQGHFSEDLNRAMSNYFSTRADATPKTFLGAEYGLENAIKHIKRTTNNKILYMNTDNAVDNMFSFPYGEHNCIFSRIGRSVCIPDLVDLVRIAEKSGVDLRIFVLERDFLQNLVSDTIHRSMDNAFAQAKVLVTTNSVLQNSLDSIDPKFYKKIKYEDMLGRPHSAAKDIATHLGIGIPSEIFDHFVSVLRLGQKQHFRNFTTAESEEHVLHNRFEERLWDYLVDMGEQFIQ